MEIDNTFLHVLRTAAATCNHDSLSDSGIEHTKSLLHDAEKVLSELNAAVIALITRRDVQAERVQKYRIALAPHKRLPPELLSEIFVRCLPFDTLYDSANTLRLPPIIQQAPWVLGQVCSRWRRISRSDPRLWRVAKISLYDKPSIHLSRAYELLPPLAPLAVTYRGPAKILNTALIPYLRRINDLDLRMSISESDVFFQSVSPTDFVALQSIQFNVINPTPEEPCLQEIQRRGIFSLANRLKRLHIRSDGGLPVSSHDIPLPQITSLDISGVYGLDTDMVLSILRDCSRLEHLDASFLSNESVTTEPLYLEHLESLHIRVHLPPILLDSHIWESLSSLNLLLITSLNSDTLHIVLRRCINLRELRCPTPEKGALPKSIGSLLLPKLWTLYLNDVVDTWLFDSLVVPSLKELRLRSTRGHLNPCVIHNMLRSSGAKPSSVFLQTAHPQNDTYPHELLRLLTALPSLTHFKNPDSMLDETTLEDIASGALLPQLESLSCWPATGEAFLGMAEARAALPAGQPTVPPRTLREAFGVAPPGVHTPALAPAAQSRLMALKMRYGLSSTMANIVATMDAKDALMMSVTMMLHYLVYHDDGMGDLEQRRRLRA
ncbi:hypothetical protein H0H92_010544 [Tricholoma furcatifolium]|nr:hypothetical protein H0H92_010544 [Tricholoma furcatifolium]